VAHKRRSACTTASTQLLLLAVMTSLTFVGHGLCQTSTGLFAKQENTTPTVKVEVQEAQGDKAPQVHVEVGGKEVGTQADRILNGLSQKKKESAADKIAPVDTEKIDEAGKKVGEKIDEVVQESSHFLGDWVTAKAFNGITWLKLISTLFMLLLVLVVDRVIGYLIRRRLRRPETERRPPTWLEVLLEALCKPLCLFIWVYGVYFAISPLFVHFDIPFNENVFRDHAAKAATIGGLIAVVWFIFRVIRLVDLELSRLAKSTTSRIDHLQASLIGKTLRWVVVIIGSVVIIQSLTGIQAAPLIASLGIGGLAVALAAKESIANLFGTLTIVFDKPVAKPRQLVFVDLLVCEISMSNSLVFSDVY
jgi:hypothetical protein